MPVFPKIGDIFNQRYELLGVLGSGGVGTVFKAKQLDCERIIALKILHHDDDDDFKERFLREARALNQISNAAVVSIYHIGVSDSGLAYIAMELVDGMSVRSLLNDLDKVPVLRAIRIVRKVAEAMAQVHAAGIVHRDLKPENIITLDKPEKDAVKVVDFGMARAEGDQKLTKTGTVMGSANYMSPEQCQGKPADLRSDIYSLTACFYEMLLGCKPFTADTAVGLLYKHINDPLPKIREGDVGRYHPLLNTIIEKGMAKSPAERYQSMQALIDDLNLLEDSIEGVSTVKGSLARIAQVTGRSRSHSKYLLAVLLAAVMIVGGMAFYKASSSRQNLADFEVSLSKKRLKRVADLQNDISRFEMLSSASHGQKDGETRFAGLRDLTSTLLTLAKTQEDDGDLQGAEKSLERAVNINDKFFSQENFPDVDFPGDRLGRNMRLSHMDSLVRIKRELAHVLTMEKKFVQAENMLRQVEKQGQLLTNAAASERPAAMNQFMHAALKREKLKEEIIVDIHLHKFENARAALSFCLSDSGAIPEDSANRKHLFLLLWREFSRERFEGDNDKIAALSFANMLVNALIETDFDSCREPAMKLLSMVNEISTGTPGYNKIAAATYEVLASYEQAKANSSGAEKYRQKSRSLQSSG